MYILYGSKSAKIKHNMMAVLVNAHYGEVPAVLYYEEVPAVLFIVKQYLCNKLLIFFN